MAQNRGTVRSVHSSQRAASYRHDNYEVEGSAARQIAVPAWEPEEQEPQPEQPRKKQRRPLTKEERRVRQRQKAFNLPSVVVVGVCMLAAAYSLMSYVGAKGELNLHMKNVKTLSNQLDSAIERNDAKLLEVEAGINYTDIYEYAIKDLGMTFPGKNQVLWFQSTESEYVSQYEQIPQE